MDDNASDPGVPVVRESSLADVAMMSLRELFASDDSVLAVAIRRVVDDLERSEQAISGWSSYVDGSGPVAGTGSGPATGVCARQPPEPA